MSARSTRIALCAAALGALVLGVACSPGTKTTAPPSGGPPKLIVTVPPARARSVPYDTGIWAQFDRALDPKSVDTTTVFLKLDTRRLSATISYDPFAHRVFVQPHTPLGLLLTYTVILSGRLRSATGDSLGTQVSWQFTTNSLYRVTLAYPPAGSLEGPVASIGWGGNGAPTNNIVYELYGSTDSAAVKTRTAPVLWRTTANAWFPRTRWTSGARVFWAVTAVNQQTNERGNSPLSWFDTYPASAPLDTLVIPLQDVGSISTSAVTQYCSRSTIFSGPFFNTAVRFALNGGMTNLRVVSANVQMGCPNGYNQGDIKLYLGNGLWNACAMSTAFPAALSDGFLGAGDALYSPTRASIQTDALAGFVEAAGRYGGWYGLLVRSSGTYTIAINLAGWAAPSMVVTAYHVGPAPRAAAQRVDKHR